jgi:hypothetical protein
VDEHQAASSFFALSLPKAPGCVHLSSCRGGREGGKHLGHVAHEVVVDLDNDLFVDLDNGLFDRQAVLRSPQTHPARLSLKVRSLVVRAHPAAGDRATDSSAGAGLLDDDRAGWKSTSRHRANRRRGFDLTFSAPESLSILAFLHPRPSVPRRAVGGAS